ncbi:MAG: 4-hydroxythreonine-4-phosphate dehydrogenase PdxA [Syntrophobacterales bacterium]|jgi:4-hydroxythreonine-4-phosphate dehydrogenase|nr:4-hydroxythreonine-4-phosphate dehydrogenase PdxA [Syntrophobacterales bacterium]
MGDPAGIGGEIILKSLPHLRKDSIPVVIGDFIAMKAHAGSIFGDTALPFKDFGEGRTGDAEFIDLSLIDKIEFGTISAMYGEASYKYVIEALKYVFSGEVAAVVTCPISKAALRLADVPFAGHTELLAHYGGTEEYVMMMANRDMRVSLATIHIPLKDVPEALNANEILKTISITHRSLKEYFGIKNPSLKVCGLNPHAGEQGSIGVEEKFIEKAVTFAQSQGIDVSGPFSADTLFYHKDCDAFVAMYHDQGLIPIKTVDFAGTVNITLGLPFIRTSPGHGTGFDIASKGLADPTSLVRAYRMAEKMITRLD